VGFLFVGMTEKRKKLYRELLWWAMVDMRTHSATAVGVMKSLLSPSRRSYREVNRFILAMNHWLHNVALYASDDFAGFSEDAFWRDYQRFRQYFSADEWAGLTETVIKELQATVD
jgi:hypothetical protein